MNVTIHDFEVVSQPEPATEPARSEPAAPTLDLEAIERALRRSRERLARVRAH